MPMTSMQSSVLGGQKSLLPEDDMTLKRFALVVAPALLVAILLGTINPEMLTWWTVAALAIMAGATGAMWELMSPPQER